MNRKQKSNEFIQFLRKTITAFIILFFGFSIIIFVSSVFDNEIKIDMGNREIHGIKAGLISVLISPIIGAAFGFIIGSVYYLPIKVIRRLFN
ncbi:hypothetical protein [Robertmurraya sp. Marseille-Q9965]